MARRPEPQQASFESGSTDPGSTSATLIDGLRRRDPRCEARFAELYLPLAWTAFKRLLGNHQDAQDATQEFMASILRSIHRFDPNRSNPDDGRDFRNWLYGVIKNSARRSRERRSKRPRTGWNLDDIHDRAASSSGADSGVDESDLREAVQSAWKIALMERSEQHARIVALRLSEDKPYKDIAEEFGLSETSARQIVRRARLDVKRILEGFGVVDASGPPQGEGSNERHVDRGESIP